ncbi:MAG: aspartate carbamoyltransferase catalytic subunit [Firmicutes bacterium]|nr:aspartate carbamoyltransferase catalytic subunit [Bacillota bacterium]
MKGLLTLENIGVNKVQEIIDLALEFKKGKKSVRYPNLKMATLFFEDSTRTNYSFQSAMLNLGITPISFNAKMSSVNKGESLYDTVKTFENIGFDGVVIRHPQNRYFDELTGITKMPVFNGGDGSGSHPTQTLLDLVTIYEEFGRFKGLKICIIGDIAHSRVAHGNAEIMKRLGMEVFISGPDFFVDDTAEVISIDRAVAEMDIIMLLRVQFERHKDAMGMNTNEYHQRYGLTKFRVERLKENAIIMHPAPFNRGVEISSDAVEHKRSRINEQMTNGVYARMAVISMTLEGKL